MNRPVRPCLRCRKRTDNPGGYCTSCAERRQKTAKKRSKLYDDRRGKTTTRGYGADWRRVRDVTLAANPLCECARCREIGRVLAADTVHHIKPVEDYPDLRLDPDNLMSMSRHCHEVEHGRAKDFEYMKWKRVGGGA